MTGPAYFISPAARADMDEIWAYYAVENEDIDAADQIEDELFKAIRKVARRPGLGHLRRDLAKEPLRFKSVRKYLIIYRSDNGPVEVVRVLHAARDVQAILGSSGG